MTVSDWLEYLRRAMRRSAPGVDAGVIDHDPAELMVMPGVLPAGWEILDRERNRVFNDEIAREAPKGHQLFGEPVRSVAKAAGSDDVIIESPGVGGKWAIVHLTYQVETDPQWPLVRRFATWEALVTEAERMATTWDTSVDEIQESDHSAARADSPQPSSRLQPDQLSRFYTAAVRTGEFESTSGAEARPYGRVLVEGALTKITGPRHANAGPEGTLCGIPGSAVVLVGTAFAPETGGACNACIAVAVERENPPDQPGTAQP